MKFATKLLHGNFSTDKFTGSTTLPIYQTATYSKDSAEDLEKIFAGNKPGFIYTRISNPTTLTFEQRIAELENGAGAVAFSSGMSAIASAVMNVLEFGDEIITSGGLFGGTSDFFHELKNFGINVRYADENRVEKFAELVNDKTKLVYVESIGNPKLDVADIEQLSTFAHQNNLLFFIDSTVTTPYLVQPLNLGADVVIHSTSKMINGGGNSIGGIVIVGKNFKADPEKFPKLDEFKRFGSMSYLIRLKSKMLTDFGGCPSPFNIFMTNVGLDTLALRMEKSCDNALKLARFCAENQSVVVNYPGLENNPYHNLAKKQFNNRFGAMLTLKFGSKDRSFRFLNALKFSFKASNLGDVRTLVIHPSSTIYVHSSENEKILAGVTDDLIRINVGIEDIDDLISDFDNALKKIQ